MYATSTRSCWQEFPAGVDKSGAARLAVGQTIADALQTALDGLQIRLSFLECLLQLVRDGRLIARRLVLRAVPNDGTGSNVGALVRIPYRRLLDKAHGRPEVGLPREEVADGVPLCQHV